MALVISYLINGHKARHKEPSPEPPAPLIMHRSRAKDVYAHPGILHAKSLLPRAAASCVSAAAGFANICIRLATYAAETTVESARVSTVTSLALSAKAIEGLISKANQDTPKAEGWAELGINTAQQTVTLVQLFTSISFHFTSTSIHTVSSSTQDVIHVIDSVFGDSESSRAIRYILGLVRRELGQQVGIWEMLSAMVCYSIAHPRTWNNIEDVETQLLWDVVVLETGVTISQQLPDSDPSESFNEEQTVALLPPDARYSLTLTEESIRSVAIEVIAKRLPPHMEVPRDARIVYEKWQRLDDNNIKYELKFEKSNKTFRERKGIARLEPHECDNSPPDPATNKTPDETFREDDNIKESIQGQRVPSRSVSEMGIENLVPRTGEYEVYPPGHLTKNLARYVRFSSASYGQSFMRLLGIGRFDVPFSTTGAHHSEHYAFAHHAGISLDQILLSSYSDKVVDTTSGILLDHFIVVDHDPKAVVLTIRGTWGLDDVLTDLACEYENFEIHGSSYKAHHGILRCARSMIRQNSRVLNTIKTAMEGMGPEYGLIICGHSLGGGVGALLSILLTVYDTDVDDFVTSEQSMLPPGRRVHCFTYGCPPTISEQLRLVTERLITSVVYGCDIVPSLSLGMLQDFQAIALAFRDEKRGVVGETKKRLFAQLATSRVPYMYRQDDYLLTLAKTLRGLMQNEKLVPPGRVIHISTNVLLEVHQGRTKKASRVVGKVVVDVERRFGELVLGRGVFDHSPIYYEQALNTLEQGVNSAPR